MPDNFIHGDDEMTIVSYGLMRTLTKEFDEAEAEIARLRKIETAARDVLMAWDRDDLISDNDLAGVVRDEIPALRVALEGEER